MRSWLGFLCPDLKCHFTSKISSLITFYRLRIWELQAYVDADWAGDLDDRRLRSGFATQLNGSTVTWKSAKQDQVQPSTVAAETIAAFEAVRELLWLRMLLGRLAFPQEEPTLIVEDNEGCISAIKNDKDSAKVKHIDIK
jgi:hypothetical protein